MERRDEQLFIEAIHTSAEPHQAVQDVLAIGQPVQNGPAGRCPPGYRNQSSGDGVEFLASLFVELDVGDGEVLLEVCQRARTGDQQDVVGDAERPGQCDLGRRWAEPLRRLLDEVMGQHGLTSLNAEPSGKNGTKAMSRVMHSSSTDCEDRSTRLNGFCTQAISVISSACSSCS